MTYSCAVWPTETGGVTGDLDNPAARAAALQAGRDELETAQLAKLHAIIDRAQLSPGDRVLEIGSGWGSLAIEAVNRSGCVVDTLTLSVEQKVLAEERIAAAGLSDKITVHLLDYRSLPESWHHQFDRVVSIEMIEAVGKEFLDGYFTVLDQALRKDRGLAVIQVMYATPLSSASALADGGTQHDARGPLRGLLQLGRLHPKVHLPRRLPAIRHVPHRCDPTRRARPLDRRQRDQHWAALRAHAAGVAQEVRAQL